MSFGIQTRGKNYVDVFLNHEKLEGVKKYGSFRGSVASFFRAAEKIHDDHGRSYYVNVSSLGRAWKKVHPSGEVEMNKNSKIAAMVDQHIKEMSDKKTGFVVINKVVIEERQKIDESVRNIQAAIVNLDSSNYEVKRDAILGSTYKGAKIDSTTVKVVYDNLKNVLQDLDKEYLLHIKDYEILFPNNVTEHGMREVIDSVYKQFSP